MQWMMGEKPDKATLNQIDRDQEMKRGDKAKPAAAAAGAAAPSASQQ